MQLLELHNFCFFIDDRQNTLSDIRQLSLSQTERGEGPSVSFKKLKYGNEVRFSYRPNTFIRHYTNKIFFFFLNINVISWIPLFTFHFSELKFIYEEHLIYNQQNLTCYQEVRSEQKYIFLAREQWKKTFAAW